MLRISERWAVLIAPSFPAIMLVDAESEGLWLSELQGGPDCEMKLPENITFDQAIKMVEQSAQANLDEALTLQAIVERREINHDNNV